MRVFKLIMAHPNETSKQNENLPQTKVRTEGTTNQLNENGMEW